MAVVSMAAEADFTVAVADSAEAALAACALTARVTALVASGVPDLLVAEPIAAEARTGAVRTEAPGASHLEAGHRADLDKALALDAAPRLVRASPTAISTHLVVLEAPPVWAALAPESPTAAGIRSEPHAAA